MANSKCVLKINNEMTNGPFINFNNCSIDYNLNMILNKNKYGGVVRFKGCHIEGIYTKAYLDKYASSDNFTPLEEDCFGLIKNSSPVYTGCSLNVSFSDTLLSMTRGTGNSITCKYFGDNVVNFNNVQIYSTQPFSDNYIDDNWKFLCDDKTIVTKQQIHYPLDKRGCFLQKRLNLIKEASFEDTELTTSSQKYNDGDKVGDFNIWWTRGIWDYDVLQHSDKKLLQVNIKDETARFYLERTKPFNAVSGDAFIVDFAIRFLGTIHFSISLRDKRNGEKTISNVIEFTLKNEDDWSRWYSLKSKHYLVLQDAGFDGEATFYITLHSNLGNTEKLIQLTDIYVYKLN